MLSKGPSATHNGAFQSYFSGSSADGRTVIVSTEAPLLAEDTDDGCQVADPFLPTVPCFDVYSLQAVPPDCSRVAPSVSSLWPANGKFARVSLSAARTPAGDPLPVEATGVTQDEPSGAAPDARLGGGDVADLRAERDPRGDGRVYRIAFRATDAGGESCTGTARVEVRRHKHAIASDSAPPAFDSLP